MSHLENKKPEAMGNGFFSVCSDKEPMYATAEATAQRLLVIVVMLVFNSASKCRRLVLVVYQKCYYG